MNFLIATWVMFLAGIACIFISILHPSIVGGVAFVLFIFGLILAEKAYDSFSDYQFPNEEEK